MIFAYVKMVCVMKNYIRKSLYMLPALLVLALGIALTVLSSLGSDCLTSFQQGLGRIIGMQVGTIMMAFNVAILVGFIFVDRKLIGLGSVLIGFCLGPLVNVFSALCAGLVSDSLVIKIIIDLAGIVLVSLALSWYIPLNVGLQPLDMLKQWFASLIHNTYGTATFILSVIFLIGAIITKGDIGIGTILNMLLVGKLCDIFMNMYKPLHEKIKKEY